MQTTTVHRPNLWFRAARSVYRSTIIPPLSAMLFSVAGAQTDKAMSRLIIKILAVSMLFLLLTACKVELYAQLDEQQGNEMLALLLDNGISSNKVQGKDNMISLHVDEKKISLAVEILRRNGFPKHKFSAIKDMFGADKLIYTPFEDRARYNYGLSQEIAETLSQMDGAMAVRVHLVMPKEERRDAPKEPASASVFVKHNPSFDFNAYIPEIKTIVANGIADMSYENVSVALFPSRAETVMSNANHRPRILEDVFSLELDAKSVPRFYLIVGSLLALIFISVVTNIYLLWSKNG